MQFNNFKKYVIIKDYMIKKSIHINYISTNQHQINLIGRGGGSVERNHKNNHQSDIAAED